FLPVKIGQRTVSSFIMPTIMDSEKYSLRQRQKRKHLLPNSSVDSQGYASDNSIDSLNNSRDSPQYSARLTKSSHGNSAGKSKSKAAPLSKYRRKTANARERTRMREINQAFETLRTCVPPNITNEDSASTNEKLTKITTLRLAMKYIGILTEALDNPNEADYDFLYECTQPRSFSSQATENLEPMLMETKEKPVKTVKSSKNSKSAKSSSVARKVSATKRSTKKQKTIKNENVSIIPCSNYQESPASNASSAYASLSSASESAASPISNSSYVFEQGLGNHNFTYNQPKHQNYHNSMSDLSNLMLESDGESLNLSERCLSPLQQTTAQKSNGPFECSPTEMQTLENPLELSLRLMEPTADALSLSVDPIIPTSSCISPLMNLESFNAFDLFHTEFNEHNALDLFLT
ncbi:hypothetical protein DOY81_001813, partial [Sarcophaga bullata]